MRTTLSAAALVLLTVLSGCSDSGSDADATPTAPETSAGASATPAPSAAPSPEDTYVPAPGDPKTHTLRITILDKGISYDPSTCRALRTGAAADRLALAAPDAKFESRPIDPESAIPAQGERLADGRCSATVTVKVRYAPRYTGGIAREGKGMTTPDDPQGTDVVTRGSVQDVDLL
ncbi:MAG: hypothetical protein EON52_24060, partial [Actinomycetales bacterium]